MRILLVIGLVFGLMGNAFALERCKQYSHDVRVQHWTYFGTSYPYHFGIGQLQQESNCRATVTAFDAGQGVAQFMPQTEEYCEKFLGPLNMYNPQQAIRAQAWYMRKIHKENWDGALWITYSFYNSGARTIKKEWLGTQCSLCHKTAFYDEMKKVCKRNVLTLKSGKTLDLCIVGYTYPINIYTYGKQYKLLDDGIWNFW